MAILEKEVFVGINHMNKYYYENLGYNIPTVNKNGKLIIPKGTKIVVKIKDLQYGSGATVTKICDVCGKKVPQNYQLILRGRNRSNDGLDRCLECSSSMQGKQLAIVKKEDCIASTNPDFAKLFWNEEDTFKYKSQSGKKADFKCPNCGNKIKDKRIQSICNEGLFCPYCSDSVSYPEKFMLHVLKQLNVEFNFQKMFENWFDKGEKKFFDFYLIDYHIIIETHGLQHYESGFETYGGEAKNLEQQIANDIYKKETALKNGILEDNYIVIDSRHSTLDHMKKSILNSKLSYVFNLSNIDWSRANEFATNSLVKVACELWMNEKSISEIVDIIKVNRQTVRKYLVRGSKIYDWCNYNGKEQYKAVVQVSEKHEYIKEWRSISNASETLGFTRWSITASCEDGRIRNNNYWIYLDEYEEIINSGEDLSYAIKNKESENKKVKSNRSRPIIKLSINGEYLKRYNSSKEAMLELGINNQSHISSCCNGKKNSAYGFKWIYEDVYLRNTII